MNDLLGRLIANPSDQFKDLTNFNPVKFLEFSAQIVPTIESHARSIGVHHVV